MRTVFETLAKLPESAFNSAERIAAGIRAAVAVGNPPLRLALGPAGAELCGTH